MANDNWGRDRAEPVAVGPPRRRRTRADRIREARSQRKRRVAGALALGMLVVVVVGAVFLGSKLWHTLFGTGGDYSGDGVNDVVIQVHDGDSTTAIAQTLQEQEGRRDSLCVRRGRRRQCRDLGDSARLLQGSYRDSRVGCRCPPCRSDEPGRDCS